ncbi:uncharacterized protein LTR77_009365 [Saxophila tyrrhenica]|uniref:Uncharacterized protein n=1 Tax=Saxophila tyrrhenica TaxID=1690608 RepID=A0AAV9NYV7_9PEZI|nr:hypothetical protein LTR77_009365 [Saxophila tyrrhenica]
MSSSYNRFDESYTAAVRRSLATFHENLSKGRLQDNGPLFTKDVQWNFDGSLLISRQSAITTLQAVVNGIFDDAEASDLYLIVDGGVGAVLFELRGTPSVPQTGPFAGLDVVPGAPLNVRSAELMVYNEEALVEQINTIDPLALLQSQLTGASEAPPYDSTFTRPANSQTSSAYRDMLRRRMVALHENVNSGQASRNAEMADEGVEVVSTGRVSEKGRDAFVQLVSSHNAGQGAFLNKVFHDGYTLADGHLGAIDYVWQAAQESAYMGIAADQSKSVRMRGMLFLEFNEEGLIVKATDVSDESVIGTQLNLTGPFLYP